MVLAHNFTVPSFILIFPIQSSMVILVLRPFLVVTFDGIRYCEPDLPSHQIAAADGPPSFAASRCDTWAAREMDHFLEPWPPSLCQYSTPPGQPRDFHRLGDGGPLRHGNGPAHATLEPTWLYKMPTFRCAQWEYPSNHLHKVGKQWILPSIW